jgi:hypothetical protein
VNLAWAYFVLDPEVMGGYVDVPIGQGDLFVLAWFVASAATVGGGQRRPVRPRATRSAVGLVVSTFL